MTNKRPTLSVEDQDAMLTTAFDLWKRSQMALRSFMDCAEDPKKPMNERIWAYSKVESFVNKFAEAVGQNIQANGELKDMFKVDIREIAEKGRARYGDVFIKYLHDWASGKAGELPPPESDATPESEQTPPASLTG